MFMFTYPEEPCSSRTWYPGQVCDDFLLLQQNPSCNYHRCGHVRAFKQGNALSVLTTNKNVDFKVSCFAKKKISR